MKELKKRAEANASYHTTKMINKIQALSKQFDEIAKEEKITQDKEILTIIENERIQLKDEIQEALEKLELIINSLKDE